MRAYMPALALALAGAPLAPAAFAACDLGRVGPVAGDATLLRDGVRLPARTGATICERDRYVTGAGGIVSLRFGDGTEVTVGRDTEFGIERWRERRFLFASDARFELLRGAFRAVTGNFTRRRHRFEVHTAIATIGVRGTDFWGGTTLTPGALDVIMLEGKGVYVTNDAGTTELRTAGEGTTVAAAGRAPSAAYAWDAARLARAVATITP